DDILEAHGFLGSGFPNTMKGDRGPTLLSHDGYYSRAIVLDTNVDAHEELSRVIRPDRSVLSIDAGFVHLLGDEPRLARGPAVLVQPQELGRPQGPALLGIILGSLPLHARIVGPVREHPGFAVHVDGEFGVDPRALAVRVLLGSDPFEVQPPEEVRLSD